ncbi:hypothetical protein K1719_029928 [Acacia pycnantha]|nr:hypothetical protein K1719_029928 [Acacia pycnantha]
MHMSGRPLHYDAMQNPDTHNQDTYNAYDSTVRFRPNYEGQLLQSGNGELFRQGNDAVPMPTVHMKGGEIAGVYSQYYVKDKFQNELERPLFGSPIHGLSLDFGGLSTPPFDLDDILGDDEMMQ